MVNLGTLADMYIACSSGDVRRDVFVSNALGRLTVAMCKGNAHIDIVLAGMQRTGRRFRRDAAGMLMFQQYLSCSRRVVMNRGT